MSFLYFVQPVQDYENTITFGKYYGLNKSENQYQRWQDAIKLYQQRRYFDALVSFFNFLKIPQQNNLFYKQTDNSIEFSFYQGSKEIFGIADKQNIIIWSDVVKYEGLIARTLLEELLKINYKLRFSKFVKTENTLRITTTLPIKNTDITILYSAMHEISITADQIDDILVEKYDNLKPINIHHITPISDQERLIKIRYIRKWITQTLEYTNKLDNRKFAGAISFMFLNIVYKIYYLVSPEGVLLNELKEIDKIYHKQKLTIEEKNVRIRDKLKYIVNQSDSQLIQSLYRIKATFPYQKPTSANKVIDFVKNEINKIHWYRENGLHKISQAICEYIIGYCEFHFGLEPVIRELFKIFWYTMNYHYINELGIKNKYVRKDKINYFAINQGIHKISLKAKKIYPNFVFNARHLSTINFYDFASSFLYEFINSNLDEI